MSDKKCRMGEALYAATDETFYGVVRGDNRIERELGEGSREEVEARLREHGWSEFGSFGVQPKEWTGWPDAPDNVRVQLWERTISQRGLSHQEFIAVWEEEELTWDSDVVERIVAEELAKPDVELAKLEQQHPSWLIHAFQKLMRLRARIEGISPFSERDKWLTELDNILGEFPEELHRYNEHTKQKLDEAVEELRALFLEEGLIEKGTEES